MRRFNATLKGKAIQVICLALMLCTSTLQANFSEQFNCQTAPIITCPANYNACPSSSTDPSVTGMATALMGDPLCGIPVVGYFDILESTGPCTGEQIIKRIWYAYDPNDATLYSDCYQYITLNDSSAPTITGCPASISVNSTDGNPVTASWTLPFATDNCTLQSFTSNYNSGDSFPIGTTTVTYVATDGCGATANCSFTVEVIDQSCMLPPTITCPTNLYACPGSNLDPSNTGTATAIAGGPFCGAPVITYTDVTISSDPCGNMYVERTWTATDANNNNLSSSCTQVLELEDIVAPTVSCPANVTVNSNDGNPVIATWSSATTSDNCGSNITLTATNNSGDSFPIGVTQVTYTATDGCGNSAMCSFQVEVVDLSCSSPPILTCPADYNDCPGVPTTPKFTGFPVALPGGPNCGIPQVTYSDVVNSQGSCGDMSITRTWTAFDANDPSLSISCTQEITLEDTEAPVVSCPLDITANSNNGGPVIVNWSSATATDNCMINTVVGTHTSGTMFPIGNTSVTYTATDLCGNSSMCSFTITVVDLACSTPPNLTCPTDFVGCPNTSTNPKITGIPVAIPSGPNCGVPQVTYSDNVISQGTCGDTEIERTWTAYDANDPSLSITCVQMISLMDDVDPVITCPSNINVTIIGQDTTLTWTAPSVSDDCGVMNLIGTHNSGDTFGIGITTVTYTATDSCGNSSTCSFDITVTQDQQILECLSDITVACDGNGTTVTWDLPTVNSSCPSCTTSGVIPGFIYLGELNGHQYYCSDGSATWIAAQNVCAANGGYLAVINSQEENTFLAAALTTQSAYIGLSDHVTEGDFEWINGDSLTYTNWYPGQPNNFNGSQHFVEMLSNGLWNDQYAKVALEYIMEIPCANLTQTDGLPNGSSFPAGTHIITYEYADDCGNSATCSFTVTVEENLTITCPSDLTVNCPTGNNSVPVSWSTPSVTTCCNAGNCNTGGPISGFIYMGSLNGSHYYCSQNPALWPDANAMAIANGGYLASINSAEENSFLTSFLVNQNAYIGLSDYLDEGNFTWNNGDPLTYTNWYPGQPNNYANAQHYVELLANGYWNDQYAKVANEYIMEIPACTTITQIAGPPSGSHFQAGTTTTITYVASDACGMMDTCSFTITAVSSMCNSGGLNSYYTHIDHVGFGPIQNTSGDNGGYADFSNTCYPVTPGNKLPITLTPGFGGNIYTVYWKIYADWNQDMDFSDPGEFIAYGQGNGTITGAYSIPWDVWNGDVTLRVVMRYGGYCANACTVFAHGETEDYCISVSGAINDLSTHLSTRSIENAHDLTPGEKGLSDEAMSIYPNPANEVLHIKLDLLEDGMDHQCVILNANGRIVDQNKLNGNESRIDIAHLPAGIYLVRLSNEQKIVSSKKLIVVK